MRPAAFIPCMLALWALALVPATCGGGLLLHACEDGAEPVCHHEESCPADPCNVLVLAGQAKDQVRTPADAELPPSIASACPAAGVVSRPPGVRADELPPAPTTVPLLC